MGRAIIQAGNSIRVKRKSNKTLYIILAINVLISVTILLKLFEVI